MSEIAETLNCDGFAGPFQLFDRAEADRIIAELLAEKGRPAVWPKGWAASSPAYHRVATDSRLLDLVRAALGADFVLWGTQLIRKQEKAVHSFHTDVESRAVEGGFVSAWIGLENVSRESGLKFIPGSHRYGKTIQEMNHRDGITRADSTDEAALRHAREFDPGATLVQPDVTTGQVVLFDGRTWHGSHNLSGELRSALLVQFVRADRPVHIPRTYVYPFRDREERPPVLAVSGRPPAGVNRVVRPPQGPALEPGIHPLPQPGGASRAFASVPHLRGRTPRVDDIEAHSSVLAPGASPHPPHHHPEEEILAIVDGTAELVLADDAAGRNARRERMGPGDFAYYPAFRYHTLVNVGTTPLLYTMMRWRNDDGRQAGDPLELALERVGEELQTGDEKRRRKLLDGATRWLDRLEAHYSVLPSGSGYAAHRDAHDVAILLLKGSVETLGRTVSAPALLHHPAGTDHGLRAVGDETARYLVFEFHRRPRGALRQLEAGLRRGLTRLGNRIGNLARQVQRARRRRRDRG